MSLHTNRNRITLIDRHICTKAHGNLETLAEKLGLSRAGTHKFLTELKEEGFPIAYSKKENRFYYTRPGKMVGFVFVEDRIDLENKKTAGGGKKTFLKIFSMSTYSRRRENNFVL